MKADRLTRFVVLNHNSYKAFRRLLFMLIAFIGIPFSPAFSQTVLFDFDSAPIYTSLPISLSAGGITANLTATGQGYSIQDANVMGFTPAGFSGHVIYPNSVYLADLLVSFDQPLTYFSIMYACQELACDDAATMRVTAYMNGMLVGSNTRTATIPGTWPVDTLSYSFAQGFNSVVIHYDSPPPTCQDYGVIFMADNMSVTPLTTGISSGEKFISDLSFTNPVYGSINISIFQTHDENLTIDVYDINGREVSKLFQGFSSAGAHRLDFDFNNQELKAGMYFLTLKSDHFITTSKFILLGRGSD